MPAWSAIFIDTCIFDGQRFDFRSPQFEALVAATKHTGIKLLLPHPVCLEIERHIKEQTAGAVSALKSARRDHPFLRELTGYPHSRDDQEKARRQIAGNVERSWLGFRKNFEVVELDYSSINLPEIMGWYDRQEPPFGPGDKRKEFPDAFAFAVLRNYAREQKKNIAVVSSDNDLLRACETVSELHHFPTLASLTDSLLQENARFTAARTLAESVIEELKKRIAVDFPDRGFYHEIDPDGHSYVDDVKVNEIEIEPEDFDVIGLGHEAFTVSFRATVKFSAFAKHVDADSWVNMGDGDIMYRHRCEGTIEEETEIDCIARIVTDAEWKKAKKLGSLTIQDDLITVYTAAPEVDDRDYEDHG
jgi:hypothetical protein